MACPYFSPDQPLARTKWPGKLRPPLGEVYAGRCCLHGDEKFHPSGEVLVDCCNLGYARHRCERFPAKTKPDAIRFAMAGDDGNLIRIRYVIECDHLPHGHGSMEYERSQERWIGLDGDVVFCRQATAYLGSYLRWKEEGAQRGAAAAAGASSD